MSLFEINETVTAVILFTTTFALYSLIKPSFPAILPGASASSSFLINGGARTPPLPIELWEEILIYVIDLPHALGSVRSDWRHFHRFALAQTVHWRSYRYKTTRMRLKLVCRAWKDIVDRHEDWQLVLGDRYPPVDRTAHRLEVLLEPAFMHRHIPSHSSSEVGQMDTDKPWAELWGDYPNLRVLSVYSGATGDHGLYEHLQTDVFSQPLAGIVRSFILRLSNVHLDEMVLSGVQQSFSLLTSLSLDTRSIRGPLTLDHLETLVIRAELVELERWNLPSLRHLYLRGYIPYRTNLIPESHQRLQSLLVNPHTDLTTDDTFWKDHTSLKFLGVSPWGLEFMSPPPPDHPLAQLFFWTRSSIGVDLELPRARKIAHRIPQLHALTLCTYGSKLEEQCLQERTNVLNPVTKGTPLFTEDDQGSFPWYSWLPFEIPTRYVS
ncbi:SubName: Full=Uncharacterized protein {ECO:0000313/EMBL:CCA75824.1} [Serendipita indica DSM 11827]|nr:SubName: Full=Uncharacterized protein {ECO:0000313/EMBL:CCA75824.1} [Serendipita indica DSM 11827]